MNDIFGYVFVLRVTFVKSPYIVCSVQRLKYLVYDLNPTRAAISTMHAKIAVKR